MVAHVFTSSTLEAETDLCRTYNSLVYIAIKLICGPKDRKRREVSPARQEHFKTDPCIQKIPKCPSSLGLLLKNYEYFIHKYTVSITFLPLSFPLNSPPVL